MLLLTSAQMSVEAVVQVSKLLRVELLLDAGMVS
jgi:hypothetical protein